MPNIETNPDESQKRPRSRWKRRLGIAGAAMVGLLVGLLFWLNGPGIRWLAPKIAGHFLGKAGFEGSFSLEGSLTGGISVTNLKLGSDQALASLTINRVTPVYRFRELYHGRLDGISVDGLRAEIRLGATKEEDEDEEPKKPFDSEALVNTLRTVRERIIPTTISLEDISISVTRDEETLVQFAPSNLKHAAGEASFELELGSITDLTGREWPSQKSTIIWNQDDISIDRIDPLPGIGIRELVIQTPASGGLSAETGMQVEEALFMVELPPGLASLRLDLREGRLASGTIAERFGVELPASGELTSLSVNAENLLPDPMAATGEIRLLLENIVSGEWSVPELSLDVELAEEIGSVTASGRALGTGFSLNAMAPVTRNDGKLLPGDVSGKFNVAEVPGLVAALTDRVKLIDPDARVPVSMLDASFQVSMDKLKPVSATVDVILKPAYPEQVSPIAVKGEWRPEQPVTAQVALDGAAFSGEYDIAARTYRGRMELTEFRSARIDPWLTVIKKSTDGALDLTAMWRGSGNLETTEHRGDLTLNSVDFRREGAPVVSAGGDISYNWPTEVTAKGINVKTGDQMLGVDATLGGGFLELKNLRWQDGETEMAGGSAKLPVPEDFAKWRETIANDVRPVEVDVETKVLSLALLKDWLPAAAKLDARSTGQLNLKVSGTYSNPEMDAVIEARDLRSPDQPNLPPADLKVTLAGRGGQLAVVGTVITPDFAPAVISANMPFRPSEWAEAPDLILKEQLTARLNLPRVDLSRFATLVAPARRIGGILTGNVVVGGELGKPEINGSLALAGGVVEMRNEAIPAITGVTAGVDLNLERITLNNLRADIAGGSLGGGGSLTLAAGKPGALDFRITGSHLPIIRNDSFIVRSNADLRLTGPWESAVLTGTVDVVDSLFYRDIELLPIGTHFSGPSAAALPRLDAPSAAAPSMPLPFRDWKIDVRARTANGFLIRGNLANGRLDADLRVGGTFGRPSPIGEVRITNLRAVLPFSTLTVRNGSLRFTAEHGLDPVLEIRGSAEPRPYRVNVYVYGRASNPQLVLTSNPPLPETEIMTLLATGATTSGLEDPQVASSRAMQLLAEEIRRGRFGVGRQLRPLLALFDRVDFSVAEADPYSSESYSTATLAITNRWYLSAGIGGEGHSRVLAIWRLTFH